MVPASSGRKLKMMSPVCNTPAGASVAAMSRRARLRDSRVSPCCWAMTRRPSSSLRSDGFHSVGCGYAGRSSSTATADLGIAK
jgi:hypothetical protein